jgi:hypothetical protein
MHSAMAEKLASRGARRDGEILKSWGTRRAGSKARLVSRSRRDNDSMSLQAKVGAGERWRWQFACGEFAWICKFSARLLTSTPNLVAIGVAGLSHRRTRGSKARH